MAAIHAETTNRISKIRETLNDAAIEHERKKSVKIPSLECRKMSKPANGKADHGTLP